MLDLPAGPGYVRGMSKAADVPGLEGVDLSQLDLPSEAENGATASVSPSPVRRRRVSKVEAPAPADVATETSSEVPELDDVASGPSVFGRIPDGTVAWGARRMPAHGGAWVVCSWAAPGDTVSLREWALASLSVEEVRRRWGTGLFQIQWLGTDDRGRRRSLGNGRVFEILPAAPAAPEAAPAASSPAAAGLRDALELMNLIDSTADRKIQGMAALAQAMAGSRGGLDAASLTAILDAQRAATAEAIRVAVEPLRAEVAAVRAAAEDEDDEDDGSTLGAVASAAAGAAPIMKGKGALAAVVNLAATNPELAAKVAEVALPAIANLAGSLLSVLRPPPPVRRIVAAPPEAQRVAVDVPPPAPTPPPPVGNDWAAPPPKGAA